MYMLIKYFIQDMIFYINLYFLKIFKNLKISIIIKIFKIIYIIIMSIVFNITTFPTTNIESFYTYSLKSNINFLFINTY